VNVFGVGTVTTVLAPLKLAVVEPAMVTVSPGCSQWRNVVVAVAVVAVLVKDDRARLGRPVTGSKPAAPGV
jgi:hypothetical protein